MCLVISLVFTALAYLFFQENNMQGFFINGGIALFFIGLLIRNILTAKKK
tara:strand:+ start:2770 stop:2919 length:150 start_codon:yes stop_codon:yes gene_type:complete